MKTVKELANEYWEAESAKMHTGFLNGPMLCHFMFWVVDSYRAGYVAAAPKWISVNTPPEKSGFYCVIPGLTGLTRRVAWDTQYYDAEWQTWSEGAMFWIELPPTLEGVE